MSTISLSLDEIYDLAKKTLISNGCDEENASILSDTIMRAERDGSHSHGLFRLPAYVAALKSKKVNGKARPEVKKISFGFAPIRSAISSPSRFTSSTSKSLPSKCSSSSVNTASEWSAPLTSPPVLLT